MLHCENFQDKFSLALTKILEDFIFIYYKFQDIYKQVICLQIVWHTIFK